MICLLKLDLDLCRFPHPARLVGVFECLLDAPAGLPLRQAFEPNLILLSGVHPFLRKWPHPLPNGAIFRGAGALV